MLFVNGESKEEKMLRDTTLSSGAKLVWQALEKNEKATQGEVAERTGMVRRTVNQRIKELRLKGYVKVFQSQDGRYRTYVVGVPS